MVQMFIRSYCRCFAFSFQDFEGYKEKFIHIQLEVDHNFFRDLISLVFLRGLASMLVAESSWQQG